MESIVIKRNRAVCVCSVGGEMASMIHNDFLGIAEPISLNKAATAKFKIGKIFASFFCVCCEC